MRHQYKLLATGIIAFAVFGSNVLIAMGVEMAEEHHSAEHASERQEIKKGLQFAPNLENGKKVYTICAVCHEPEGWGDKQGYYPQIAGQLRGVIVKQMADIRAGNRDNPTMLPFTSRKILSDQDIFDVAAYLEQIPMNPDNGIGPGDDLEHGKILYDKYCVDCHGAQGEGHLADNMPLIQGQHYEYLVRQFEWIRTNKRRNADKEMVEQIKGFSRSDVSAIMDYVSRMRPPSEKLAEPGWLNPDFPQFVRFRDKQTGAKSKL